MVVDTLLQRPWDKFKAGGCHQSPMSCPGFGGMEPAFGEEKQVGLGQLTARASSRASCLLHADVPRWGMGCSNSSSLSYINYIFSPHGIKLVLIISARGKRLKIFPKIWMISVFSVFRSMSRSMPKPFPLMSEPADSTRIELGQWGGDFNTLGFMSWLENPLTSCYSSMLAVV